MRRYLPLLCLLLLTACTPEYKPLHDATTRYASLLKMETLKGERTLCRITNPWVPEQAVIQYLLVDSCDSLFTENDLSDIRSQYGEVQLLRTPLQRQALTSSCHAWLLGQFDALSSVRVMCDAGYVIDSTMSQLIACGEVLDGGSSMAPNTEVLLSAGCDALWISPFENAGLRNMNERFGLPEIYCADYMETSPLGRAEWMRFYGRLVGKEAEADSLFRIVEARYDSIARQADTLAMDSGHIALQLLCELPYSGTWYVAGGRSTLGLMYQDAGFDYPWSSDTHAGSLALSPEAVFSRAQQADVWLIKYNDPNRTLSCQQLRKQHPFFPKIKALKEEHIYGCNTAHSNYFDITPFRPDLLLEELSNIANNRTESLRFFELLPSNDKN